MKKGIFVKGFAVVLAASMLTGCGALSAEDYKDAMEDAMDEYEGAVDELSEMMYGDEDDFDKGEAKKVVEEAKDALKSIKSLSAPKEIKDDHKELCEGLDVLVEVTDLMYDAALAYVEEDDDKLEEIQEKVSDLQKDVDDIDKILSDIEEELDELIEEEDD